MTWALGLFFAYSWLTFVLRRFPYTRPWGESLREFLLGQLSRTGAAILQALPGLFTVLLIVLLTRFAIRTVQLLFLAVEEGRVTLPWMYPETAQPTRKLLTVGLWLFAVAIAYPYLPGSNSEAFKGMSVFVGLVVSLGSSGIVNQVMSGFTLTYSRALRAGDFVAVGDVEGTVTQVGTLATKIKTAKGEDVTIPNALVVSQTVTNYTRFAEHDGVFVPTDITIGYDVPWRQVRGAAAARGCPHARRPPRAGAGREAGGARGCLHQIHPAVLPRAPRAAPGDAGGRAREHPRRVQRVRGADHLAQLRSGSSRPESRASRSMVRGTRGARRADDLSCAGRRRSNVVRDWRSGPSGRRPRAVSRALDVFTPT